MDQLTETWHPGSFTKNFGWGAERNGLSALHRALRVGFADDGDVPRAVFRNRLEERRINPFIPLNFFVFNERRDREDFIIYDELAFQACQFSHGIDFDRLALFTFNLSIVGKWTGARAFQSRPSLWSNRYIVERLDKSYGWDTDRVNSNDIQDFLEGDNRYVAQTSRKLSTNLNYLYRLGGLASMASDAVERWWMNAALLAADRIFLSGANIRLNLASIEEALEEGDFTALSGPKSAEKSFALKRIIEMYIGVGGPGRFAASRRAVASGAVNDQNPFGLIDKQLPRVPKSLPPGVGNVVSWLNSSYDHIDKDEIVDFEVTRYVRDFTQGVLRSLRQRGMGPTMNSSELMKLMRG